MILYEFIAGRLPYDGDSPLSVMNQHVTAKAPSLHFFCPDVPPPLEEIVMKAIRRAPAGRWQGMDAFIAVLENWDAADVPAVRLEREQERGENPRIGGLAGKLNVPASKTNLLVLAVLVLAVLVLAVLVLAVLVLAVLVLLLVVLALGVTLFARH